MTPINYPLPSWAVVGRDVVCIRSEPWTGSDPDLISLPPAFMQTYRISGVQMHPSRPDWWGIQLSGIVGRGFAGPIDWVWSLYDAVTGRPNFAPPAVVEDTERKRVEEPVG